MKLASNMDCGQEQDMCMLVSIINFNQRRIEELLRLRNTNYQSQVKVSPSKVPILPDNTTDINKNQSELRIPRILITNAVEKSTSSSSCQTKVIVDHSVPLVEASPVVVDNCKPADNSEVLNKLASPSVDIPGFDNSEHSTASGNQDVQRPKGHDSTVNVSDNANKLTDQAFIKFSDFQSQIVLRKSRGHRKKYHSLSTVDENRSQAQKAYSGKRKRYTSLPLIDEQGQLNIISPSKWSKKDIDTGSPMSISSDDFPVKSATDPCSVATKSDDELLRKKTKIIKSSPRKKTLLSENRQYGPKPPSSDKVFSQSKPDTLEPFVACWRHCPAHIPQQQHCYNIFSRHQFIDHLQEFHVPPTPTNLENQQIVCICHSCENVVNYSHAGKRIHLDVRCSNKSWNQQFFLFVENVMDQYGIPDLNFPVVQSPGLEGMFKSIAHHPQLDTMAWKNTKNEHFCYHYCNYCRMFIADTVRAVSDHAAKAIHRVNVRKASC